MRWYLILGYHVLSVAVAFVVGNILLEYGERRYERTFGKSTRKSALTRWP